LKPTWLSVVAGGAVVVAVVVAAVAGGDGDGDAGWSERGSASLDQSACVRERSRHTYL